MKSLGLAILLLLTAFPESTLQDVYKSFYQDRFGPGHMIADTTSARQYLMYELGEMTEKTTVYYEPTGSEGRFVRVYLSAVADSLITADQLLDAFIRSANMVQPSSVDWEKEWRQIEKTILKNDIKIKGFEADTAFLREASRNHQAVHHSRAYNVAYHPHYRIVERGIFENELLPLLTTQLSAQDMAHYKEIVKELSSEKYQGRGYAKDGANLAGKYLYREFEKIGADVVVCQPFTIDINTFAGEMRLSADGKELTPGVDFSMREYSPGVHGEFPVYHVDTLNFDPEKMYADLAKPEYANCLVVCEFWFSYRHGKDFARLQKPGECTNAGVINTWTSPIKYYKAYGHRVVEKPIIWMTPEAVKDIKTVRADIDNEFLKGFEIFNVIAKVEGQKHDSCFVFTAHYDHLGNLGKEVYYPGANDNASGTAAIVTLAAYYAKNRPEYDMYFIAFSGEDANLRGSEFYAQHPLVPLGQIKYLFNLDMIGDNNPIQYCEVSDEGLRGYKLFEQINDEQQYFKSLNRGQLAGNSDHYPFATRHVPCIFLENQEGDAFPFYHTIYDTFETFRADSYEPVFKLVRDFVEKY